MSQNGTDNHITNAYTDHLYGSGYPHGSAHGWVGHNQGNTGPQARLDTNKKYEDIQADTCFIAARR